MVSPPFCGRPVPTSDFILGYHGVQLVTHTHIYIYISKIIGGTVVDSSRLVHDANTIMRSFVSFLAQFSLEESSVTLHPTRPHSLNDYVLQTLMFLFFFSFFLFASRITESTFSRQLTPFPKNCHSGCVDTEARV